MLGPISPPGIAIGGLQEGSNDPRASYGPICLISGFLGAFWVIPEPQYGTSGWVKRLKHIHLDVFHLDPTWIHLDPPIWGLQGTLWPDLPHLWLYGPFRVIRENPYGTSRWVKRLKHIHLDVFHLDPTWIHLDSPIWGLQGTLWPDLPHLWLFGAISGHSRESLWHFQMG